MDLKRLLSFAIAAIMLLLCSCSENIDNSEKEYKKDIFAMDTYMTLKLYGENGKKAATLSQDEIMRLEKLFSVTDEQSDIAKINNSSGNGAVVSDDTIKVATKALDIASDTDGALDISIYPVLKEWGFTTENYKVPDSTSLSALLQNVDYKNISINQKENKITVPNGYMLDFGSVAKGYTSDRICEIIRENGVSSALVNLGGNVQAVGKKNDGSLWKVAIEHPKDKSDTICKLSIDNKAVVTSGNYERFFEAEDGKKYWHIIDPKTGFPADNGLISASVIGSSGLECDALSTALFVMGTNRAIEFCSKHTDIDAVLIDKEMNIYITDGLRESITVSSGYNFTFIDRLK